MILVKYILNKIFKNQLIILTLLFLVCICQKLIKILGLEHNIIIYLIVLYLTLSIPELGKLLIPFSLFLSVIITCYQLHIHNEILAMYSCGLSKYMLIKTILLCSSIVSCIAFVNLSWLSPYCEQYQNSILSKVKKNTYSNICTNKKFQLFLNQDFVLFVDQINNKKLKNVFIANKRKDGCNEIISIITADQGDIKNHANDLQLITLDQGIYYEIDNNLNTYNRICITNFLQHQILIDLNCNFSKKAHETVTCMFINQLWNSSLSEAYIELNWRITLLISIFIMPIIAVSLIINVPNQYLSSFLLAMILYIIFFLSHIVLRSYGISLSTHSIIWIWLINFIYFILICLINFQEKCSLKNFFKKNF